MKKLIIGIIVVILLGSVVFILGLLHVPHDQYAVVYTSFAGFDAKALTPDTYAWRWEKLIPSALVTYLFKLESYEAEVDSPVKGNYYPSGNEYAKAAGVDMSFEFDLRYKIEFSIIPGKLRDIVSEGLRPEKLSDWYKKKANELAERITQIVVKDPQIFHTEGYLGKIGSIIKDDASFDSITIVKISPEYVNLPDYDLYLHLKQKYMEIEKLKLEAQIAKLNAEKDRDLLAIKKEIDIIQNLDKYGETFKNYPILLEFLYLRNLSPEEFLKLSEVNFSTLKK
jgi:hypothetical protein